MLAVDAATSTSMASIATLVPACQTNRYSGPPSSVANAAAPSCCGTATEESMAACFRATVRATDADAFESQFKTSEIKPVLAAASS